MVGEAITTADVAIYLDIYASVVLAAAALWVLADGGFHDRARIRVKAFEASLVTPTKGPAPD